MDRKIEINLKFVVVAAVIMAALYLLWRLRSVVFILMIAYLISAVILPFIGWFQKRGLPEKPAIFAAYFVVIAAIIGVGGIVFPPAIAETTRFYARFPEYFSQVSSSLNIDTSVINRNIEQLGQSIVKVALAVVSSTIEFVTIFVVSVYISFERKNFRQYLINLVGVKGERVWNLIEKVESRLAVWLRGQLLLCLIIGVATYIGLTILGFPYAVPLAVMAGIFEVLPNIGPIVSAIPAVIIGLSSSAFMGITAAALYTLIQQLENHLIVPRIMSSVSGLKPLAVIIVLLIGGSLMGTVGLILAIPVYIILQTVILEVKNQ